MKFKNLQFVFLICLLSWSIALSHMSKSTSSQWSVQSITTVSLERLRTNYQTNPLGIDTGKPIFSWELKSDERGQKQTGYQIVARDGYSQAVLWDSQRVNSDQQAQVVWQGPLLVSMQRLQWQVRVWDKAGIVTPWSHAAFFEVGLLEPRDWGNARWLARDQKQNYLPSMPFPHGQAQWIWSSKNPDDSRGQRWFWTDLNIPKDKSIRRASGGITGDDEFTLFVNDRRVSSGTSNQLEPVFLENILIPGKNRILVSARNVSGPTGIAGIFVVEFTNGEQVVLKTDASWHVANDDRSVPQAASDMNFNPAVSLGMWGDEPWGYITFPANAFPAPLLRTTFRSDKTLKRARVYFSGLGFGEVYINGVKLTDSVLEPGYTKYDKRALYVTYEAERLVKQGENAIGVMLGNGFYNIIGLDTLESENAVWKATPRMILKLLLEYADGSSQEVVSNEDWKTATGPITFDGIRQGESYDARLERLDWAKTDTQTSGWRSALVVPSPTTTLSARMFPPMRVTEDLKPKSVKLVGKNSYVFDLGQNFAGWVKLRLKAPSGTIITLSYGERLKLDGSVDQREIAAQVMQGDFQRDQYIARGASNEEVWEPRFVYHGFQYVQITGSPALPSVDDVTGRVVQTDFPQIGFLETSSTVINKIQSATLWSYRSNFHSVPTDCPHREKQGWMADAHIAAEQAMYNFDNTSAYLKWVRDITDAQRSIGDLPAIVPTAGFGYDWGNGPAWDSALFVIPALLNKYVGDTRVIGDMYASGKRYLEYLETRDYFTQNPSGWLGDWAFFKTGTPEVVTNAAFHYYDAQLMATFATQLGYLEDHKLFLKIAHRIRERFLQMFVDSSTGRLKINTQTALTCSMYFGIIDFTKSMREQLLEQIKNADNKLDFGLLGAKCFSTVLTSMQESELVYQMITQPELPSWGHWMKQGATTLWEHWDGSSSRNHIFMGDVSTWFWRSLAGIQTHETQVAFKHVIIKPETLSGLTWVKAKTHQIRGEISVEWKKTASSLVLEVLLPPNTTGTIILEAEPTDLIKNDGGKIQKRTQKIVEITIESGKYSISITRSSKK